MTKKEVDGALQANLAGMEKLCEVRMADFHHMLDQRIQSVNEATRIAKDDMDRRLEGMNEFRATLQDQASRFVIRSEYNSAHERLVEDIRSLRESRAEIAGKASMSAVIFAYGIAVMGLVLSVISFFHK